MRRLLAAFVLVVMLSGCMVVDYVRKIRPRPYDYTPNDGLRGFDPAMGLREMPVHGGGPHSSRRAVEIEQSVRGW